MKFSGHLHFLGIAGQADRSIALAVQSLGYQVSGTDETADSIGGAWLDAHNINWSMAVNIKNLNTVDTLVLGDKPASKHPMILAAIEQGIEIISSAELIGVLASQKHQIAICGTPNKTIITAMIIWLLESAGRTPDFLIGAQPKNFDTSTRITDSPVIVLEADEHSSSLLDPGPKFEHFKPNKLVITSIESDDHAINRNKISMQPHYKKLSQSISADGLIVYWEGSIAAREAVGGASAKVERYGFSDRCQWRASNIRHEESGLRFVVAWEGRVLGELAIPLSGEQNALNAVAAVAICISEGLSFGQITQGFGSFLGVIE